MVGANNDKMLTECAGDVGVILQAGEKETNALFRDVEYVPGMLFNLLSIRQMTLKGNKVLFQADKCKIFDKGGELLATAEVYENLYKLNCCVNICDSNLRKVISTFNGIECINNDFSRKCEVCIKGKQTRMPFEDISHRATNLLEIVHSDIMGLSAQNLFLEIILF